MDIAERLGDDLEKLAWQILAILLVLAILYYFVSRL